MQVLFFMMTIFVSSLAFSDLPENELWRYDNKINYSGINQSQFNEAIKEVSDIYAPIAKAMGFTLNIEGDWEDATVNAYTQRDGTEWYVAMFGGLARRAEVTKDGFKLVICHEIAHQMGGYPMRDWAAYEGQADYIATHVCGKKVFKPTASLIVTVPRSCLVWEKVIDQKICAKNLSAGQSLGNLLAVLNGNPMPKYETPDPSVVTSTQSAHPKAQCRLDSYLAGTLCTKTWDDKVIPADSKSVCDTRPKCWYYN
jgi:hypothetical protein